MRRTCIAKIAAVLALGFALMGCGSDSPNEYEEEPQGTLISRVQEVRAEIYPSITWTFGCIPCDPTSDPDCDTIDAPGGCGMGEIWTHIGCSWGGGTHSDTKTLGTFDFRSYSEIRLHLRGFSTTSEYFTGYSVWGETWRKGSLSSFAGENAVTVKIKFSAYWPKGSSVAEEGEALSLCESPHVYIYVEEITLRGIE